MKNGKVECVRTSGGKTLKYARKGRRIILISCELFRAFHLLHPFIAFKSLDSRLWYRTKLKITTML